MDCNTIDAALKGIILTFISGIWHWSVAFRAQAVTNSLGCLFLLVIMEERDTLFLSMNTCHFSPLDLFSFISVMLILQIRDTEKSSFSHQTLMKTCDIILQRPDPGQYITLYDSSGSAHGWWSLKTKDKWQDSDNTNVYKNEFTLVLFRLRNRHHRIT